MPENRQPNGTKEPMTSMPDMIPSVFLKQELATLGKDEFLRLHACPFLGIIQEPDQPEELPADAFFKTANAAMISPRFDPSLIKGFVEIKKSNRNSHSERIAAGRSSSNDLVIRSTRVSGSHAHFIQQGELTFVMDIGSRNGTYLNGERIPKNHQKPLCDGDVIIMGENAFLYISPSALPKFLEAIRD